MDWHIPLIVATALFLAFMVIRVWPVRRRDGGGQARSDLATARKKLDAATSDEERVVALCDAGDAASRLVGGSGRAVQYYLRAMKLAPGSIELIERASKSLARRPRGLETLLWRRLGTDAWSTSDMPSVIAAVDQLAKLYAGPLRSSVRARALAHIASALAER